MLQHSFIFLFLLFLSPSPKGSTMHVKLISNRLCSCLSSLYGNKSIYYKSLSGYDFSLGMLLFRTGETTRLCTQCNTAYTHRDKSCTSCNETCTPYGCLAHEACIPFSEVGTPFNEAGTPFNEAGTPFNETSTPYKEVCIHLATRLTCQGTD